MKKNKERMLIIELNEFCPTYLQEVAERLGLVNIIKFLNFQHTSTFTKEKKEFHGLDPWVQWVSIHNGIPLPEHGVKRLGINSDKSYEQVWNKLANKKNISWIVTGAMNAKKGSSKGCISFFPDPWSSKETAYPKDLNNLLELPRYVSKNYLSLDFFKLIKKSFKTITFFIKRKNLKLSQKMFLKLFQSILNPGINIHTLTTLLDYLLVLYFCRERYKKDPDLSIIFLNHIAHLQHHFWIEGPDIHPQMKHGLKICDEIIKTLLDSVHNKNEQILIKINYVLQVSRLFKIC